MIPHILRKIILPTTLLFVFLFVVPNQIKAQISGFFDENDAIGISPLMNAAIGEDVSVVSFFIKSNPTIINQKNIGGATALHIAARKGNLEICKILIENGANVNLVDNDGWSPLMRAVTSKNLDLVKMLLGKGVDVKQLNSVGESPIIISAYSECSECLKQILSSYNSDSNFATVTLKNQLDDAMIIARNRNDVAMQSILTGYINIDAKNISPTIGSLNNNNGFRVSNKAIITEQLPELVQNKTLNKIDKETNVIIFKLNNSNNKYNKKIFIFKGSKESKTPSSQHLPLNNQSSTNQKEELKTYPVTTYSSNSEKHQYKFLGKIKSITATQQQSTQSLTNNFEQNNVIDKIDEKIIDRTLKSNNINNSDNKKIFIFKGSKSQSLQ